MSILKFPVTENDHWQGNTAAKIELVEYGDYQCPHCGHSYPIVKAIQEIMGDDLKFVFRNFPLSYIHRQAKAAALAAEAAALQNKFWEMHDIIFENQGRLEPTDLFSYAQAIGLDLEKFRHDIRLEKILEKVESDIESGARSGVNGTPSFFVNGKKWEGDWQNKDAFLEYLQNQ